MKFVIEEIIGDSKSKSILDSRNSCIHCRSFDRACAYDYLEYYYYYYGDGVRVI